MNNSSLQLSDLEKAVLKTLAFFDIFDYPLTIVEIHKWLYAKKGFGLLDIITALEGGSLSNFIEYQDGFYFLKGRAQIIEIRLDRYQIADEKFKIARRVTKFLRWVAFIKLIAVCNTVGYNNASAGSDIDFFIIVRRGRVWWSRLLITSLVTLLRVRRHEKKVKDRICLSFYVADDHLDLAEIAILPLDIYLIYWFATLAPIYDLETNKNFFQANNWLFGQLPNFYIPQLASRRQVFDDALTSFSKKIDYLVLGRGFGDWLEHLAEIAQFKRLKRYLGDSINQPDHNVVVSSQMLKFHKIDRRQHYLELWQRSLKNLGLDLNS
jgi:hypothetical protein